MTMLNAVSWYIPNSGKYDTLVCVGLCILVMRAGFADKCVNSSKGSDDAKLKMLSAVMLIM